MSDARQARARVASIARGLRRGLGALAATLAAALALVASVGGRVCAQPRAPVIQQRVTLDPRQPVNFHVVITPDTVFVGQQATYELGVFITETAQQRMRRNPEVVPAELRGVLAYDLGGPQSLPPVTQQGVRSYPHVLQRAVFPLAAGTIEIPASRLTYALPRSTSFFSREEQATLRGDDVSLVARPLPTVGRPSDFSGAVGELAVRAQLDGDTARVGEPLVLTVRVSGRGNVKLWPRPVVRVEGTGLVESSERVRVDSSGQYVRGSKEFDWLVTPEREGALSLPPVRYVYFDPYDATYRTSITDSLRLVVTRGEFVGTEEPLDALDGAPLRRIDRGPVPLPWHRQAWPWIVAALAPLLLVRRTPRRPGDQPRGERHTVNHAAVEHAAGDRTPGATTDNLGRRTPREAVVSSPSPRSVDGAPASDAAGHRRAAPSTVSGVPRDAVRAQRQQWHRELADALATSIDTCADRDALQRRLRRRGVTRETTARVLRLGAALDAAAWGAPRERAPAMPTVSEAAMRELLGAVRAEAVPSRPTATDRRARRRDGRTVARLLALCVALMMALSLLLHGAQVAAAQAGDRPAAGFREALAAFDARDYPTAARGFAAMATAQPRHADAWVNAGTAAWAAGDTAQAVRAWQRALRLDPAAEDVRQQLGRLSSASWQGLAAPPSVRANRLTALALALWLAGWVVAALARAQPVWWTRHVSRTTTWGASASLLLSALAVAGWQARVESVRAGAALAVIATPTMLRVAPGAGTDGAGAVSVGEVVQREAQRIEASEARAWSEVTHADGRRGWLPDDALLMIR